MSRVTALFDRPEQAVDALNRLSEQGFSQSQISLLMSDQARSSAFNIEKGSKAGEGFTIGASVTGLAAAVAAGLASVGVMVIPGLNLVAYGPLVAALTAGGAGAAAGGVVGGLIGWGIPEYEAKTYEKSLKEGAVLIAVDAEDSEQEKRAKEALKASHANKIAA